MEITINHQQKTFDTESLSLQSLLDLEIPQRQKGIAVACNNRVVPKAEWPSTLLSPHDAILIITATQGG
jgi:sulfur carrier protein